MLTSLQLLRQGRREELWQMCCGFIDLSLEEFMTIQRRLLLEQIELLKKCQLGRKVMRGTMPRTVDEFREQVPLTTYEDYCPELVEKRDDVLPAKPVQWLRSCGGPYVKWLPMSESFTLEYEKIFTGHALFALCNDGNISHVKEHLKILLTVGPPEYTSGFGMSAVLRGLGLDLLPSKVTEGMSFQEKIAAGFEEALDRGLDGFGGIISALLATGEQISKQSGNINTGFLLSHPRALFRVTKGLVKSKLARRPMLPRDLWSVKGILSSGTDSANFKEKVAELWGRYPLELYAGTEGGAYATQTWDHKSMTFIPNLNFLEFIPEDEHFKWQLDHSYQPKTVLLDEVRAGENYELVITNFHGGAVVRYRPGDMVRITSLRNEKLNIELPQMVYYSRADDLIDISGFGRLTEKVIWEAIENTGSPYVDWTARKEMINAKAMLHVYVEPKDNYIPNEKEMAEAIYDQLIKLDSVYHYNIYDAYGDPENVLGLKPILVTLLPQGAFSSYIARRQAKGAALGHLLKPPRINASDGVLTSLMAEKKVPVATKTEAEATAVR